MNKKSIRKLIAATLSVLVLFGTFNMPQVFAEEPPTATAEPTEDTNIKFTHSLLGFDETFDNSGKTNLPKDYSFTSATSTVGYTVSKITISGQVVRDEDEITTLENLTIGQVEGQKEDGSWVLLADFGNSATSTETINIKDEKDSLDTTTVFEAIRYSGLIDNSTGLTIDSYDSSKLKLEVEFMPIITHKVSFIDDVDKTSVFTNCPDGFSIDEDTITKTPHTGYLFNSFDGNLENITEDSEVTIKYDIQQYDVLLKYKTENIVDGKYDFGTKFTILKRDGSEEKTYTLDENGLNEELTPFPETGYDFIEFEYDDLTKTITPKYEIQKFTVTFVDKDGNNVESPQEIEYGGSAVAPTPKQIEGYSFIKWNEDFSNITSNLTVTSTYDQIILDVYVTCNGSIVINHEKLPWGTNISILNGDLTPKENFTITQDTIKDLPLPLWVGHTFVNWSEVDDGTGNKTLTPNFVVNEYSVRFLDKEKNVIEIRKVKYGETVTPPTPPTVKGYIFDRWSKPLSGITEDCDIEAVYSDDPNIHKYDIKFSVHSTDTSYGTLSDSSHAQTVYIPVEKVIDGTSAKEIIDKYSILAKTIGSNSKFEGWYEIASNGDAIKITDINTYYITGVVNLEARFYPDINANDIDDRNEPITIVFNTVNGGTIPDQTIYVGAVITTPTIPSRSGYIFSGWYTSSSYATKWNFGDAALENMTLYAKWNKQVTPTPTVVPVVTPTATSSTTTTSGITALLNSLGIPASEISSAASLLTSLGLSPTNTSAVTQALKNAGYLSSTATVGSSSSLLNGTYSTYGQTAATNSLTTQSTAKPVVTINPTLYIHPTITFHSETGFLEGTETMNYGTNIYVYDGNGNKLAEYSARQDCDIVLPEPGLIKNKVFSGYHIYWEEGSLIVQYEYINDYSNGPIESDSPTATPTATPVAASTNELASKLWMLPWFLGGLGLLGIFILLIKKLFKKDKNKSNEETETSGEVDDEESSDDLYDAEEELVETESYDDDDLFNESNSGATFVASATAEEASASIDDLVDDEEELVETESYDDDDDALPIEETPEYKDTELVDDSSSLEDTELLKDETINEPVSVTAGVIESDVITEPAPVENKVDIKMPEKPFVEQTRQTVIEPKQTNEDVFENILKKYAKKTDKGGK